MKRAYGSLSAPIDEVGLPKFLGALAGIAFFAFLRLVSTADLSFAVPATAASYVFETILASYVLKERVNPERWIGAVLVSCGVALLSL